MSERMVRWNAYPGLEAVDVVKSVVGEEMWCYRGGDLRLELC